MFAKNIFALTLSAALTLTVAGCSSSSNSSNTTTQEPAAGAHTTTAPHFTYGATDATGPAHWGTLSADWATCGTGNKAAVVDSAIAHQSPIDFAGTATATTVGLIVNGTTGSLDFTRKNNGHTIQLDAPVATAGATVDNATIIINSVTYTLAQFHFHAGSEHTDSGQHAAMEIHFVFANKDTATPKYAVVGAFINAGPTSNPELAKALAAPLPADGAHDATPIAIAVTNIISDGSPAFRYVGSFTTPPCTEGVEWTVLETPLTLNAADIKTFTDHYSNNFRPVQGTLN